MGYNKLISSSIIPTLLISYFVIPIASIVQDSYLAHICSDTAGKGTAYQLSLTHLVEDLVANAPLNDGFRNASRAEDPADRAYGLALCRGDVSTDDCKNCLGNATIEVANTSCTHSRGAIIWHDYCMLKYSNNNFFGQINTDNNFSLYSGKALRADEDMIFTEAAIEFFSELSGIAITEHSQFYANASLPVDENITLYAMVQCTRDLSVADCKTCLYGAVTKLYIEQEGGRVVYASCQVRYDTYQFFM